MKTIRFIPSTGNIETDVCTSDESFRYKLSKKCCKMVSIIYYHTFIIDTEVIILNKDWCIITNAYDGEEYCEQCMKVTFEKNTEIFYGMEGTRCLLIDAVKIVGTTNKLLKEVNQIIITEEMLREYYNKPLSFMEEDLVR